MSTKEKAIELRRLGKSYGEILKELKIKSKGNLSYWFRNIQFPAKTKKLLDKNYELARKRNLSKFNDNRTSQIIDENKQFIESGKELTPQLGKNALQIIGASLYWGEGTKAITQGRYGEIGFSNSDPAMIKVFIKFLVEVMEIPLEQMRVSIHTYPHISDKKSLDYWSKVTGINPSRICFVRQISGASGGKRSINKLPYGTINLKAGKRKDFYVLMGMMTGMSEAILGKQELK